MSLHKRTKFFCSPCPLHLFPVLTHASLLDLLSFPCLPKNLMINSQDSRGPPKNQLWLLSNWTTPLSGKVTNYLLLLLKNSRELLLLHKVTFACNLISDQNILLHALNSMQVDLKTVPPPPKSHPPPHPHCHPTNPSGTRGLEDSREATSSSVHVGSSEKVVLLPGKDGSSGGGS